MDRIWEFEKYGPKPALTDDMGTTVTYSELESACGKVCGSVQENGLVMMFCSNTVGSVTGYMAFINNGFPVMMLSAGLSSDLKSNLLKTYRPPLLMLPEKQVGDYPFMTEVLRFYDYVVLKTNYTELYPVNPKLGLLLTTSGSTGSVKYVRQSFENIRCNATAIADYLGLTDKERTVTALPMHYTYGLSMINSTLLTGGTMAVTDKSFMEESFWDFFEEQKVTGFHGVSNTYDILRRIGIFEEDFPDLTLLTQAGGRLSNELQAYYAAYAEENGKRFVIMYGQSEATAAISYLPFDKASKKPGSVGIPINAGRILLKDEEDNVITGSDTEGELCYEGPNVAMGYALCGEDLIKGDEWNGCLRTGDVARMDEDGYYYITGRLKRFLKISGHRISLDELDEKIMDELHIPCVSSGIDDHPVIFVNRPEEKEAVLSFVKKAVPTVRPCLQVALIDEFPKNESGKIKYGELLQIAKDIIGQASGGI